MNYLTWLAFVVNLSVNQAFVDDPIRYTVRAGTAVTYDAGTGELTVSVDPSPFGCNDARVVIETIEETPYVLHAYCTDENGDVYREF